MINRRSVKFVSLRFERGTDMRRGALGQTPRTRSPPRRGRESCD
jgi:hypothetical protein